MRLTARIPPPVFIYFLIGSFKSFVGFLFLIATDRLQPQSARVTWIATLFKPHSWQLKTQKYSTRHLYIEMADFT
jgi:hypothetical protein